MGYDFEKLIAEAQPVPQDEWRPIADYDSRSFAVFMSADGEKAFGGSLHGKLVEMFYGEATPLRFEPVHVKVIPDERIAEYIYC